MRTITLDELARRQPLAQSRQGPLPLNGCAKEFAVPVLIQVQVEVLLRKVAKPHDLARFDILGEHDIRRRSIARYRGKRDRAIRGGDEAKRLDTTHGQDRQLKSMVEHRATHCQFVELPGTAHQPSFDEA